MARSVNHDDLTCTHKDIVEFCNGNDRTRLEIESEPHIPYHEEIHIYDCYLEELVSRNLLLEKERGVFRSTKEGKSWLGL